MLQPGRHYLVQEAAGAGNGVSLPTPEASGTIAMSAITGKVALVSTGVPLSGSCPFDGTVVDFVGYGSANCFEGTAAAPALGTAAAALRSGPDTNNNGADFVSGAPNPRN
jgi:hypothetical protein